MNELNKERSDYMILIITRETLINSTVRGEPFDKALLSEAEGLRANGINQRFPNFFLCVSAPLRLIKTFTNETWAVPL